MTSAYEKLLLSELRLAVYSKGSAENVDDERMVKAMTVNENLRALGYTLNAADLLRLAGSASLDGFYASFEQLVGQVNAVPMYPDFPQQVMEISEAEFRFHQMVHYFSTYGMEELFGVKVSLGWLPQMASTQKVKADETLLDAKVLELVDENDMYLEAARRILRKRERMTLPEAEIIEEAVVHLSQQELLSLEIPFKENLRLLAYAVFHRMEGDEALSVLHGLHQHTGDVLESIAFLLRRQKYHFRTSQKRLLVKLIETYPVKDWRANVILSNKKAQQSLMLLNHLDYSMYSRSAEHMAVVDSLRDGELHSWEGQARCLLSGKADGALDFVAKRPGMLLRMVAWLIRIGYDAEAIVSHLCHGAAMLSVQTLVTVLNFFGSNAASHREESSDVYDVLEKTLLRRLSLMNTCLHSKKVFLDEGGMNLAMSTLKCSGKSAEGGYVPSGTVYKIPDNVRYVRFFVYWDDRDRVDVDLHAAAMGKYGYVERIGWNNSFRENGIVFSGDITHSDAAEYIDVDLNSSVQRVAFNIHLFSGKHSFGNIRTCFTGLMAVNSISKDVALYNAANCFFSTELRSNARNLSYGYLDIANRTLVFTGMPLEEAPSEWYHLEEPDVGRMNIARYLELLLEAQDCTVVQSREEADTVLVVEKPQQACEVSLIDNNYFMDAQVDRK